MTRTVIGTTNTRSKPHLADANAALFPERSKQSFIDWPTELEVQRVSEQLARIRRVGIRSEANGEYFKSGELAYQIQEVIRATRELSKKSERGNG